MHRMQSFLTLSVLLVLAFHPTTLVAEEAPPWVSAWAVVVS